MNFDLSLSKKSKKIRPGPSERIVSGIAYVLLTVFALLAILPCLHVISKSISTGSQVTAGLIFFWPKGFQLETIKYVLTETSFFNSLKNSLIITAEIGRAHV